jgi:hypothetical protein
MEDLITTFPDHFHNTKMWGFDIKDMLALTPQYEVFRLDNLPREEYIEVDFINHLRRLHEKLWAFYIFCGDRSPETLHKVYTLCAEILKSKKDLRNFLAQASLKTKIGEQPKQSIKENLYSSIGFYSYSSPFGKHSGHQAF